MTGRDGETILVGNETVDLGERMQYHEDVDWETVSDEELEAKIAALERERLRDFVEQYAGDLPRLYAVWMLARRADHDCVTETLTRLFGESVDAENVTSDVDDAICSLDLECGSNVSPVWTVTPEGEQYYEVLCAAVDRVGGDSLREFVRGRIREAPPHVSEGVSVLTHFVRAQYGADSATIAAPALARTWAHRVESDVDADAILTTGLATEWRDSRRWGRPADRYRVPSFALAMLEAVEDDPAAFGVPSPVPDEGLLDTVRTDPAFRAVLDWLAVPEHRTVAREDRYLGPADDVTVRSVDALDPAEEERAIREFLSDRAVGYDEFVAMRNRLLAENVLVYTYEQATRNPRAREVLVTPALWGYEVTGLARQSLPAEFRP